MSKQSLTHPQQIDPGMVRCAACGREFHRSTSTGGDLSAPLCQDCWEAHSDREFWKEAASLVPTGTPDQYMRITHSIDPRTPIAARRSYRRPGA